MFIIQKTVKYSGKGLHKNPSHSISVYVLGMTGRLCGPSAVASIVSKLAAIAAFLTYHIVVQHAVENICHEIHSLWLSVKCMQFE